jgi:acetyl esterase/lipase
VVSGQPDAVLILVGTADRLMPVAIMLHDSLAAAGKSVRLEIYEALFDSALDALEKSVLFAARPFTPLQPL